MSGGHDEAMVEGWLQPVGLDEMLDALRHAGFSGDVYRGSYGDLEAMLENDRAGALHFLRHGYAENRVFATRLDLDGLNRLRRMPLRNRAYLQNVFVALATAWTGCHIHDSTGVMTNGSTIERLRRMGAAPVLLLGDASAALYRRGVSRDDRWICPLAFTPVEGGIETLLRTKPSIPKQPADREAIPTIWKFGQSDIQRHGAGELDAFAIPLIGSYAKFLAVAVPLRERAEHWIAGLFPPVLQQEETLSNAFGSLLDLTDSYRRFNALLEKTALDLGFNVVRNFDNFLTTTGVIDKHYVSARKNSDQLAYDTTAGILSTSLWSILDSRSVAVSSSNIVEQFTQLLQEIRAVQIGEAG